jgi:hypothetical protein
VVIGRGSQDEIEALCEQCGLGEMLFERAGKTSSAYGVRGTPSAVLVDVEGRIASRPAAGAPAIEALVRTALRDGVDGSPPAGLGSTDLPDAASGTDGGDGSVR